MDFKKWKIRFHINYTDVWFGKAEQVVSFKENEERFSAHFPNDQVVFLQKEDNEQMEEFLNGKNVEFLFGCEKQIGMYTELVFDFRYEGEDYRVLAGYGCEGRQEVDVYAWGDEKFPYFKEIAREVCSLLLKRPHIRLKYVTGTLPFHLEGIINQESWTF